MRHTGKFSDSSSTGIHCCTVEMDDGRVAVMAPFVSSRQSGTRADGEYFGHSPFQVMRGEGHDIVIGARPSRNGVRLTGTVSQPDTRIPWAPTVSASWGPYVIPSDASLPAVTGGDIIWSIESQPDVTIYRPTYGVDHEFYLVLTLDGVEYYAAPAMAGASGTLAESVTIDAALDEIITLAQLYTNSTRAVLVNQSTYSYIQNNP